MQGGLNILIYLALGAVVVILGAGLWNMTRGGNPNLSQRLMRARVIAQFLAIILLVVAVAVFGSRG